jgi:ribose transport system substrate-binding protein
MNDVPSRVPSLVGCAWCLVLSVLAFGCSGNGEKDKAGQTMDLAFIPKTGNNLVFDIGYSGAKFGARVLNETSARKIDVEYLAPLKLDPDAEQAMVRDAIVSKKDGILVSCVDGSITDSIDEAVAAGIPVITYDSDCPASKRLGFYSMKSEETGARGADLLASAMGPGKKTIAVLTGRAGADNLERRLSGFTERLSAAYPDISIVTTVHCMETVESCGPAVEDEIVGQNPDLDGLFAVGLWGLAGACTCSESGQTCLCNDDQMPKWKAAAKGKLKTVSYDSLPFEITLVQQGYVSALIGQKYFGWGYDTVSLMYDHLTSNAAIDDFIDSGFDVVCSNNADQMSEHWQAADFSQPLMPACDL